jgi:hypothetical protein
MPPNCSNRPIPFYYSYQLLFQPTVLLLLLLLLLFRPAVLLLLFDRSVPLFQLFYRHRSNRLPPTNCHRLTATDRPVTEWSAIKSSTAGCVLLLTNCYRVLLPSVLPLTVLFYFTALNVYFYYCFYYRYYYYCYCCYCCRYYFWFTAILVATRRKIGS